MKINIIRLGSVVQDGVGDNSEAAVFDVIYTFLLQEFKEDIYNYIRINQIGDDLEEHIFKEEKNIYINIRYPKYENFNLKCIGEKNLIRLDVVHTALIRLSEYDKKLNKLKLEEIKRKIIENNFSFYFEYKIHIYRKKPSLKAKILIHPAFNKILFFVSIENDGLEIDRILLYISNSIDSALDFFNFGKWKNEKEFVITGKKDEMEIKLNIDNPTKITFLNLTKFEKPPLFDMMRSEMSNEEKSDAQNIWLASLPQERQDIIKKIFE